MQGKFYKNINKYSLFIARRTNSNFIIKDFFSFTSLFIYNVRQQIDAVSDSTPTTAQEPQSIKQYSSFGRILQPPNHQNHIPAIKPNQVFAKDPDHEFHSFLPIRKKRGRVLLQERIQINRAFSHSQSGMSA